LKFAGVPQTSEPILAASGPKFAILWGHGKRRRRRKKKKPQGKNIISASATQGGHKKEEKI